MNAFRAAALRLILPFVARVARVDFLGIEDEVVEFAFDLEEVLLAVRDDDDERLEEDERDEEAWPPFCAVSVTGSSKATAMNATPMRLYIISFLLENSSRRDYGLFKKVTQEKGGRVTDVTSARQASSPSGCFYSSGTLPIHSG